MFSVINIVGVITHTIADWKARNQKYDKQKAVLEKRKKK